MPIILKIAAACILLAVLALVPAHQGAKQLRVMFATANAEIILAKRCPRKGCHRLPPPCSAERPCMLA